MSRNRTPQRKPAKPLSDTNRDRRARRGEKQASQRPKPAPATEPVAPQPMPAQEAALLPTFARELVRVEPPAAAPETAEDTGHWFPGRPLPEGKLFRVHREFLDKLDPENPAHAGWFSPKGGAVPTLPPTDQAVEKLLEQLGRSTPPDRAALPADHPAHRLSLGQWVRLQVTLEAMGRGENAWRAMEEVAGCPEKLDRITRQILAFGEGPDLRRRTFEELE